MRSPHLIGTGSVYLVDINHFDNRFEVAFGPMQELPNDLVKEVFSACTLKSRDLAACNCVCRNWNRLIMMGDLEIAKGIERLVAEKNFFFFGKVEWEQKFGAVGKPPPLPRNICEILDSRSPMKLEGVGGSSVAETHLLVLIPRKVNGEPLTPHAMGRLVKACKTNIQVGYEYVSINVFQSHFQREVGESHWVLLTKGILMDSRTLDYSDQKKIVEKCQGYRVAQVIDFVTAFFAKELSSCCFKGNYFDERPWTFVRCENKDSQGLQITVGRLTLNGICLFEDNFPADSFAVAGSRLL